MVKNKIYQTANLLTALVLVLQICFMVLEMFFWATAVGLKVFQKTLEDAMNSQALAANQGLYNGFLAAGLLWGLVHADRRFSTEIKLFFLGCVAVAGLYGWRTAMDINILYVQALPAMLGFLCVYLAR
jgi:putative membrane protein